MFKWVRINALTEESLGDAPTGTGPTGVDVNADGSVAGVTPLFYDPANMNASHNAMAPGLIEAIAPPATALQALDDYFLRGYAQRQPEVVAVRRAAAGGISKPRRSGIQRRSDAGGKQRTV